MDEQVIREFENFRKARNEKNKEKIAIRDERIRVNKPDLWERYYGDRDTQPQWQKKRMITQDEEIGLKVELEKLTKDGTCAVVVHHFKDLLFYLIKANDWAIYVNIRDNPKENTVEFLSRGEIFYTKQLDFLDDIPSFIQANIEVYRKFELFSTDLLKKRWLSIGEIDKKGKEIQDINGQRNTKEDIS